MENNEIFQERLDKSIDRVPFSVFDGVIKQLHVDDEAGVFFDYFFPRFRTEFAHSSYYNRGDGRVIAHGVILGGSKAIFTGRGRERRFAGDASLPRQRYYCLEDSASNEHLNNTLLNELFAYADPRSLFQPELLDTTVDTELSQKFGELVGVDYSQQPAILQILRSNKADPFLMPSVFALQEEEVRILCYPMKIEKNVIDRVIDLRLPETLQWFFDVFVSIETIQEGKFIDGKGRNIITGKFNTPNDITEFLPTLFTSTLGGGSTFIQGIGAYLRSIGVQALIYPSARTNSRSLTLDGKVQESFGYILVNYRDAPVCEFQANKFFGVLPNWIDKAIKNIQVKQKCTGSLVDLEVTKVRTIERMRFKIFHTWSMESFFSTRQALFKGEVVLSDRVNLVLQKPSSIYGVEPDHILDVIGDENDFMLMESGAATGFLFDWVAGNYNIIGQFICSVIPVIHSDFWDEEWFWDERSWFITRLSLVRPWATLRCPICFNEYFWNIHSGPPLDSCVYCDFSHEGFDGEDVQLFYTNKKVVKAGKKQWDTKDHGVGDETLESRDSMVYSAILGKCINVVNAESCTGAPRNN